MSDQQRFRDGTSAPGGQDLDTTGEREQSRGISPLNPSSMPRAEDDDATYAGSPEFHDREPNDPSKGQGAGPDGHHAPDGTTKRSDSAS